MKIWLPLWLGALLLLNGCAHGVSDRAARERTIRWAGDHSISGVVGEETFREMYGRLERSSTTVIPPTTRRGRVPAYFMQVDAPGEGSVHRTTIDRRNGRNRVSFIEIPDEAFLPPHIIEE